MQSLLYMCNHNYKDFLNFFSTFSMTSPLNIVNYHIHIQLHNSKIYNNRLLLLSVICLVLKINYYQTLMKIQKILIIFCDFH